MSTMPPDIAKTTGPLLLGHLLQWGLFGALSVQVYIYYLAFPHDPVKRKVLVYAVYAAEMAQVIIMSRVAFKEYASGFGNMNSLDNSRALWFAVPLMSSVVAAVVQIFYAYRIKILAQSKIIPIVVILFALVQLAGGMALGIRAEKTPLFSKLMDTTSLVAAITWNAGSAVCDVIIAVAMTFYLSKRRTEWKPTRRKIQKATRLVIETGTLTAAVAIVNLTMYLIPGHPTYFQTSSALLGKMYSSTLMVVLNSRMVISGHDDPLTELSSIASNRRRPAFTTSNGGIMVTREHWSDPLDLYPVQGTKEEAIESDIVEVESEGYSCAEGPQK